MNLSQKLSGFAKTFRSALLTRWRVFSDSGGRSNKELFVIIAISLIDWIQENQIGLCFSNKQCIMTRLIENLVQMITSKKAERPHLVCSLGMKLPNYRGQRGGVASVKSIAMDCAALNSQFVTAHWFNHKIEKNESTSLFTLQKESQSKELSCWCGHV